MCKKLIKRGNKPFLFNIKMTDRSINTRLASFDLQLTTRKRNEFWHSSNSAVSGWPREGDRDKWQHKPSIHNIINTIIYNSRTCLTAHTNKDTHTQIHTHRDTYTQTQRERVVSYVRIYCVWCKLEQQNGKYLRGLNQKNKPYTHTFYKRVKEQHLDL